MPFLVRHVRFLAPCLCLALVCISQAKADVRADRVSAVAPAIKHSTLLNPVALLSQAIASIVGLEPGYVVLGDGPRVPASLITRHAVLALSSAQSNDAELEFVAGHEQSTVTLLLAESQVRVRLAPDLLLRCEVSSRDEANTDAELKFDLGVQFKFK